MKAKLALLFLVTLTACAVHVPPPKTVPEGAPVPEQAWANVLARHVDDQGRIDFAGIAKEPANLDAYVVWIARISPGSAPESFPTGFRNTASGLGYGMGRLANVFGPLLVAFLYTHHGYTSVFIYIAVCWSLVAILVAVLGPRTQGQSLA